MTTLMHFNPPLGHPIIAVSQPHSEAVSYETVPLQRPRRCAARPSELTRRRRAQQSCAQSFGRKYTRQAF